MLNMLSYSIEGEGIPVVLLHGFLESSTMWDYLSLSCLEMKFIRIDLPGHGKSIRFSNDNPTIDYFASCVIEVLDELKINQFHVLGHSMGGYVALNIVRRFPQRLFTCGLLNSNFWSDSEDKKRDRTRVVEIVRKNKNIFINEAIPRLFHNQHSYHSEIASLIHDAKTMTSDAIAFASIAMRDREDNTDLVNKLSQVEIYIIQGDEDKTIPLEVMKKNLLLMDKLNIISNSGHMSHIEQSSRVSKLLIGKLNYSSISN